MTSRIEQYTNARLAQWYRNAKLEYNVDGSGIAKYDKKNDEITISYTENNNTKEFKLKYLQGQPIDWAFNVWAEEAA